MVRHVSWIADPMKRKLLCLAAGAIGAEAVT
jgi:hypothetical protein